MELRARDKRALIGGSVVVVGLLAYLLWPRGVPQSSVELVSADQRQPAAPSVATAPTPPAQPIVQASPAVPAGAMPEGLKLTGVTGTGAIFSFADGSQRLVRRGGQVAPGMTLQAVRLRDVIVTMGAGSFRLGFGGALTPILAQPVPMAASVAVRGPPSSVAVPAPPAVAAPAPPTPPPDRNLFQ